MSYKSSVCGYFYGDEYDYILLVSFTQKQSYKFLFKNGKIYKEDLDHECDKNEFESALKKLCNEYANKILEHQEELNEYEKIYASRKNFNQFIKRHHFLKYEIRKFQNKISHFYETLSICQSEQQNLKKELKNSTHEANVFRTMANEYACRIDDIYTFIQSIKNDKINQNIYILTMISAVMLPLNLITGFFGMNTQGLPFNETKNATIIVVSIMLGVILCCTSFLFWYTNKKK